MTTCKDAQAILQHTQDPSILLQIKRNNDKMISCQPIDKIREFLDLQSHQSCRRSFTRSLHKISAMRSSRRSGSGDTDDRVTTSFGLSPCAIPHFRLGGSQCKQEAWKISYCHEWS
ncbi:hypothetical protein MTR_3g024120 [Medicago truncatula]|uniref:Uncharacterized protein n=1 Tax=Medicago truncatula TaxID=3880 RepID=A0A072UU08_MEDTR|nr:hypothetical protein MTR_3g024120 [Medicago truncatula]